MSSLSLSSSQIQQLASQGCTAADWENISVHPSTDLSRIRNVNFTGNVAIGANNGATDVDGVELPCGMYNATIANCIIGNNVRIANIGSAISNYHIGDDVLIEDVASLTAGTDASFGNGVELDVVNEGGGRGTLLFNNLSAQTAYLQALLRHDEQFTKNLFSLIKKKIVAAKTTNGIVESRSRIAHCGSIHNVNVMSHASIHGALFLENGTVLSCNEHPTEIGEGVHAKSFVLAEGARVDGGAMLDKVYVGQGAKIGKQYSAENSLFFANCEGFHGEAVSLFAGPYTVTHHKSTLLIAGLFSFYNAGSGSNQSNHMYKLGPVHQGIFERGCKTGSFSYVLLESRVGAFSVVIGKHFTNMNVPNLPFSYIHEEGGESKIIPGMNLFSVGTVRDGEKWPKRDNRKAADKRDLIIFDVFSPYTVEKMRRGRNELLALSESVPKEKTFVNYGGLQLNRLLLRKGAKYYTMAISRYLNDKVCLRLRESLAQSKNWKDAAAKLGSKKLLMQPKSWTDLAGLLAANERVASLVACVRNGDISSYDQVVQALERIQGAYCDDEWEYVCEAFAEEYTIEPSAMTKEHALKAIEAWKNAAVSLHSMILEDSKREFGDFAKIGFGLDQAEENIQRDFDAVRGTIETNSVVQKLTNEGKAIEQRFVEFKKLVEESAE
ncbi:MAG: DUF4954 family protein [Bacteroidota bacterium]|nr:DUF4954 family protein [Bacteroidota bacterium]